MNIFLSIFSTNDRESSKLLGIHHQLADSHILDYLSVCCFYSCGRLGDDIWVHLTCAPMLRLDTYLNFNLSTEFDLPC